MYSGLCVCSSHVQPLMCLIALYERLTFLIMGGNVSDCRLQTPCVCLPIIRLIQTLQNSRHQFVFVYDIDAQSSSNLRTALSNIQQICSSVTDRVARSSAGVKYSVFGVNMASLIRAWHPSDSICTLV